MYNFNIEDKSFKYIKEKLINVISHSYSINEVSKENNFDYQLFSVFNNDFLKQNKKYLSDFRFLDKNISSEILKNLEFSIMKINELYSNSCRDKETFRQRYIDFNESIKDLFVVKLQNTEDLYVSACMELDLKKRQKNPVTMYNNGEQSLISFFKESEKTNRELYRRNFFDDYLSMSIKLIDSSFAVQEKGKLYIPMEQSLGEVDIKFFKDSFAIYSEEDKKALIDSFKEMRDLKRQNPDKKFSFEEFSEVANKYNLISVNIENKEEKEKVLENELVKEKVKTYVKVYEHSLSF